MRTCTKCGATLPASNFNNDKSRKDGKHPWCKPCARTRRNAWYKENREANLAYQAEWRAGNAEKKAASDRRWGGKEHRAQGGKGPRLSSGQSRADRRANRRVAEGQPGEV